MKTKFKLIALAWLALSTLNSQLSTCFAQGTAFMYQGRLQNNGSPASGTYNLEFTLFGTNTDGTAVAGPVTTNGVIVANGLFTVMIDFGPGVFTGGTNWLEIAVETNLASVFTTLAPRQQLMPVPYAIYAERAGAVPASQLTSIGNTNVGSGNNFFVGPSGNATTSGDYNTGDGYNALGVNAGGSDNTAVGGDALSANTSGNYNTAIGVDALFANTGGYGNTALGFDALLFNTTGNYNTAIGYAVLQDNTSGSDNTANGDAALELNTVGSDNMAYGYAALYHNTSGAFNIALGYEAGFNLTTGSSNIDIGNVGLGTDANIIRIGSGQSQTFIAGVINGNGGGLTNLAASQFASGLPGLTIQQNSYGAPNLIGGASVNFVSNGIVGATIGGGGATSYKASSFTNSVTADFGAVGGGIQNTAGGLEATIGGGAGNTASSDHATIGGGGGNTASAGGATVGGGAVNTASGIDATVSGGEYNIATNEYGVVGGGYRNTNNSYAGTVAGGYLNVAGGSSFGYATVGGGLTNDAYGDFSTIGGGSGNKSGPYGFIGGGSANNAQGAGGFIGGGYGNSTALNDSIGGGINNNALGTGDFIGGGGYDGNITVGNVILDNAAAIVGGLGNTIPSGGEYAFIGGGLFNTNVSPNSTISGGINNQIQSGGLDSAIGGGGNNSIFNNNSASAIAGGSANTVGANVANGFIGGGYQNTANGNFSTVPGGQLNVAGGDFSFAAGQQAQAFHQGAFVWADSQNATFSSTANNQFLIRARGGVGIGTPSPAATLHVFSTDQFQLEVERSDSIPPAIRLGKVGFSGGPGLCDIIGDLTGGMDWYVNYPTGPKLMTLSLVPPNTAFLTLNGDFFPTGGIGAGGDITTPGNISAGLDIAAAGAVSALAFVVISDRNAKENFKPVDNQAVLARVASLPVTEWNYKTDSKGVQHIGPMAQDFQAAFQLSADDKHISVVDEGGVALAAIQGLNEKVESGKQKSETRMEKLEAENAELKARLEALEKIVLNQKSN